MEQHVDPVCPVCGFRVFNRRYSRCESCAAQLPASLVYSASQRRALLDEEVERLDRERAERKQAAAKADAEASAQLLKAAVLLAAVAVANSGNS